MQTRPVVVALAFVVSLAAFAQGWLAFDAVNRLSQTLLLVHESGAKQTDLAMLEARILQADARMGGDAKGVAGNAEADDEGFLRLAQRLDAIEYRLRATAGGLPAAPKLHRKEILSPAYHIDARYRSMTGPQATDPLVLLESDEPELLWVVGYRTVVVDAESGGELSQEFMCHANLDLGDAAFHFRHFPRPRAVAERLFTLSQGQQEIRFPKGFGIPALSNQPLALTTQVLNLNLDDPDLHVRHRVEIFFVRDAELREPMRPLYHRGINVMRAIGAEAHFGLAADAVGAEHGSSCSVGMPADGGRVVADDLDQKFAPHWVVEPGREVSRTNVTRWLRLPFDTKAHYIAVHLHPFAKSIALRDLTTDETLWEAKAAPSKGRIGLDAVEAFESEAGLPLFADHEYELVSVYENTSGAPVDAMATMYLYLHNRDFRRPHGVL